MRYALKRILCRLHWNRWLSILMVLEIAVGTGVFTYSLNLHYSLAKEENRIKRQERDLVLQISSKEGVMSEEVEALTWQDYQKIQQISEGESYLFITVPGFYATGDQSYDYILLLADFEKLDLETDYAYWGSHVREIMDQDLLNDDALQNKSMPEMLDQEVWNTETEEIALQDCIAVPITYMEEMQEAIAPAWIHMEWDSRKMADAEETVRKIEGYLEETHGNAFNYRIYNPEIELSNNSEKVKTSIQAMNKAGALFLLMVFVGMTVIFHLLFEHRKESYGVSLACGADSRKLWKEIFGEILCLNGLGTITGSGTGFLLTYYLDLQIMIGYVEVAGDLRTVLWNMAVCSAASFMISLTIYRKLKRESIVRLLYGS